MKVPNCEHSINITHDEARGAYRLQHGGNPEHSKLIHDETLLNMNLDDFAEHVSSWLDAVHKFEAGVK